MSYFEGICKKCGNNFTLNGNVSQNDFKGTPIENKIINMSIDEFQKWYNRMWKEHKLGWVEFDGDIAVGYGGTQFDENDWYMLDPQFVILDEMQRWERDGQRCPECGEPDCD